MRTSSVNITLNNIIQYVLYVFTKTTQRRATSIACNKTDMIIITNCVSHLNYHKLIERISVRDLDQR